MSTQDDSEGFFFGAYQWRVPRAEPGQPRYAHVVCYINSPLGEIVKTVLLDDGKRDAGITPPAGEFR